ncbi:MAG: NAD-binding protein [Candidatus Cloacimonetes bacterium]|nr:NAD-binding protein [Candidatus Cloacimonadota bacterium]MCF7814942.1 NAD-binding protein [Candidatus Cloacimonadota bacterium]MCF7867326.1 NAD-binding protein [Candidatus Cloacimonadota bacterium]MCF7882760.1 NAD-binding protein [Candidatus Cloacimonadota bacterium]
MKFKRKLARSFSKKKQTLALMVNVFILFAIILAGAIGVLAVEYRNSDGNIKGFFDAIWWSLVTITTVGYGDKVPVTFWGRIIGIIFIFLGFTIFSTFTAFIASNFIDKKIKERKGLNKIKDRNHILICGWNRSAIRILEFMNKQESNTVFNVVLVNELDDTKIHSLQNQYPELNIGFIHGDFTNQETLMQANAKNAVHIILLFDESKEGSTPSDERTIIAAHNLAFLKMKGKISIQLHDGKYLPNLRKQKIQNVVIFDDLGGNLLGYSTVNPAVPDFLQEVLRNTKGKGFKELKIPKEFVGKTFDKLYQHFFEKEKMITLGLVSIRPEVSIEEILSDDSSSIDRFIKQQFELSGKQFNPGDSINNIKIKPDNDYLIQVSDVAIVL